MRTISLFCFLLLCGPGRAQTTRYLKAANTRINLHAETLNSFECHITIDPANKRHFLAAVLTADSTDPKIYFTTWIKSADEGKTWQSSAMPVARAADPWCAILPNGAYMVSDIFNGSRFEQGARFSFNQGASWTKNISLDTGYDHDKLIVDHTNGRYAGNVYLSATKSLAAGEQDPHILIARFNPNGQLVKTNKYYPFRNANITAQNMVISSDGLLYLPVRVHGYFTADGEKSQPVADSDTWIIVSKNGGNSFSAPKYVTSQSGEGHHVLTINKHSKWKDHLYYFFTGNRKNGLYLTRSENAGESWYSPVRVDRNDTLTSTVYLGAAVAGDNGDVGLVYREKVVGKNCYTTIFKVFSGETGQFSEGIQLDAEESCAPDTREWYVRAWPQGGDYCGMVALPGGGFRILWSSARAGKFQLFTTTFSPL